MEMLLKSNPLSHLTSNWKLKLELGLNTVMIKYRQVSHVEKSRTEEYSEREGCWSLFPP